MRRLVHRFAPVSARSFEHEQMLFVHALQSNNLAVGTALLNRRFGHRSFRLYREDVEHSILEPIALEFIKDKAVDVMLTRRDFAFDETVQAIRFWQTAPILDEARKRASGKRWLHIYDEPSLPGIAFCSNRDDTQLIADSEFLGSFGYRELRRAHAKNPVPWKDRIPTVFWRGTTTGVAAMERSWTILGDEKWWQLPRVQMVLLAKQRPDLMDVGFTGIVQIDAGAEAQFHDRQMLKPSVETQGFSRYRSAIDIDGNSNSWGLFHKLLAGCCVLKVASPRQHRQWYYDRLVPHVNYVPVQSDLADLIEKAEWVRDNPDEAQRIAAAGQRLAQSMTYKTEIDKAARLIATATVQAI